MAEALPNNEMQLTGGEGSSRQWAHPSASPRRARVVKHRRPQLISVLDGRALAEVERPEVGTNNGTTAVRR
jgi:hypothetical protein